MKALKYLKLFFSVCLIASTVTSSIAFAEDAPSDYGEVPYYPEQQQPTGPDDDYIPDGYGEEPYFPFQEEPWDDIGWLYFSPVPPEDSGYGEEPYWPYGTPDL